MLIERLSDLGVTITQLGIAVHLDQLGHLSGSDLARHVAITPQAAATALGNLEKLTWVERVPHPVHKRVIWYRLTELGETKVREGRARIARFHEELKETLGAELVAETTRELTSINEQLLGPQPMTGTLWPVHDGSARSR